MKQTKQSFIYILSLILFISVVSCSSEDPIDEAEKKVEEVTQKEKTEEEKKEDDEKKEDTVKEETNSGPDALKVESGAIIRDVNRTQVNFDIIGTNKESLKVTLLNIVELPTVETTYSIKDGEASIIFSEEALVLFITPFTEKEGTVIVTPLGKGKYKMKLSNANTVAPLKKGETKTISQEAEFEFHSGKFKLSVSGDYLGEKGTHFSTQDEAFGNAKWQSSTVLLRAFRGYVRFKLPLDSKPGTYTIQTWPQKSGIIAAGEVYLELGSIDGNVNRYDYRGQSGTVTISEAGEIFTLDFKDVVVTSRVGDTTEKLSGSINFLKPKE